MTDCHDCHTAPPGECLCGDPLDHNGDCPRCTHGIGLDVEYADCRRCQAVLDEHGNCWYCDRYDDTWWGGYRQ